MAAPCPARRRTASPRADASLAPFPDRMPTVTRLHCKALDERARNTKDSTLALRLDRKITALYERWD